MNTLNRLLKLIGPFRWWVLAGVLLSFAAIGSSVGLIAMSAYLISKAAVTAEVVELSIAITFVRTFAIARASFRYAERYITHRATFRILTHLRARFYQSIEPLAPARLQKYRSGDLLARIIADIETLQNFYVRVVVPPLAAALVTVLASAILGSFDIWLGLALLAFLGLTGVILPLASRQLSRQPAEEFVLRRSELDAALVDDIQGSADLLVYCQEEEQHARLVRLSVALNRSQERLASIKGAGEGLAILLASLAGLTVLFLAIPLVSTGHIQGVYLALLPLTAIACFEATQPLSVAFQTLQASQAAARRLFELMDAPPPVPDPARPSPRPQDYSIEVRKLQFQYTADEPPVLHGVSFTLPAGSCTNLIGPSGAGKTSLVNLLLRFWDYQSGEIRIGGHELHEYQADDVRQMMSVVSQHTHLFNGTVQDNLWVANPAASQEQLVRACEQAQLHEFIHSLPHGYETMIGENGLLLSGGERQRLAIARALLKDAPILILDEATANLDAITQQRLSQALQGFMAGRTALVISHQRTSLFKADQVVALENGRLIH